MRPRLARRSALLKLSWRTWPGKSARPVSEPSIFGRLLTETAELSRTMDILGSGLVRQRNSFPIPALCNSGTATGWSLIRWDNTIATASFAALAQALAGKQVEVSGRVVS